MNDARRAEDLYTEMRPMPMAKWVRFFYLLANSAFREDDFTHAKAFGKIHREPFSAS